MKKHKSNAHLHHLADLTSDPRCFVDIHCQPLLLRTSPFCHSKTTTLLVLQAKAEKNPYTSGLRNKNGGFFPCCTGRNTRKRKKSDSTLLFENPNDQRLQRVNIVHLPDGR